MTWDRTTYEASLTSRCFSWTPFCEWEARWGDRCLKDDLHVRRLVELEQAASPIPLWAQMVCRQIDAMPPCGWAIPQHVEAVCTNIGRQDAEACIPPRCYSLGPERLELMARIAVLLDGWVKGLDPDEVAAGLEQLDGHGRPWWCLVHDVWGVLGERQARRVLLARRLLARLRFWLRAPYGPDKADDNARLGYMYSVSLGKYPGWDYFGFEEHEPEVVDLNERIRRSLDEPQRWIDLITYTWPCAPKAFRFIERLIAAIGRVPADGPCAPTELPNKLPTGLLRIDGTYLDTDTSRGVYSTAIAALSDFVGEALRIDARTSGDVDPAWRDRLPRLLGKASPLATWLVALVLVRLVFFEESFRSFHFTRNIHQVA
ncbi:MAG: hypothetical protein JW889_06825 [Verrucomicrobia bacterium]|nr:hypothetical protein [Verrucomicrobiota bacterium]